MEARLVATATRHRPAPPLDMADRAPRNYTVMVENPTLSWLTRRREIDYLRMAGGTCSR